MNTERRFPAWVSPVVFSAVLFLFFPYGVYSDTPG